MAEICESPQTSKLFQNWGGIILHAVSFEIRQGNVPLQGQKQRFSKPCETSKSTYPIILLTISNYLPVKAPGDKFSLYPAWQYHQPDMSFV